MPIDSDTPSTGTDHDTVQWPPLPDTSSAPPGPSPLEQWRRAHDALLEQERAFAQVVTRHAHRQASLEELALARKQLQAQRELVDTVLQRALGVPCGR